MAGFRSVKQYTDAWEAGRFHSGFFKKSPFSTNAGWYDMSMYGGGPPANYYASDPLAAATLNPLRGIFHGDNKSPSRKAVVRFSCCGDPSLNPSGHVMLADYVMYYPFIDMDDVATQVLDNTVTLPRYTSGEGLMVMGVCTSTSVSTSGEFTFTYVNQNGVTKTSPNIVCPTITPLSTSMIVTGSSGQTGSVSALGPWLPLDGGDGGVRQINSVRFTVPNGGLMTLVLVKPLLQLMLNERQVQTEKEMISAWVGYAPVEDGAYLNIIRRDASMASNSGITGMIETIWDEGT